MAAPNDARGEAIMAGVRAVESLRQAGWMLAGMYYAATAKRSEPQEREPAKGTEGWHRLWK